MAKIISFFVVVLVFSFYLFESRLVDTKLVCNDESMLTHCKYSYRELINYQFICFEKNYDNKTKEYVQSRCTYKERHLTLTCQAVGFTSHAQEMRKFISKCHRVNNSDWLALESSFFHLAIKSSAAWPVINSTMEFNLQKFKFQTNIHLVGFKGFDIESPIRVNSLNELKIHGRFDLYARNRLVNGCDDYFKTFNTKLKRGFIFDVFVDNTVQIMSLTFYRPDSKRPVCSLCFGSARISHITFDHMINSFYLKRMVTFEDRSSNHSKKKSTNTNIRPKIKQIKIMGVYGLDVDRRFLNPRIFASISLFVVNGHLNSIATDAFLSFSKLKRIILDTTQAVRVIRKQGIAWINSLNSHVFVNLSNITNVIDLKTSDAAYIELAIDRDVYLIKNFNFLEDEDFCLMIDFPFNQLISIIVNYILYYKQYEQNFESQMIESSCTDIWLHQFYNKFKFGDWENSISRGVIMRNYNFSACDFPKRIDLCQKSRFHLNSKGSTHNRLTPFDLVAIFELLFVILAPIISAFGIITNLIAILVIFYKKNKETMRQKHYLYLIAYCMSNLIIFVTQILNLMSECQFPFGFYCSSIHRIVFIQYIKIIFGEYLNSACRLFSNFAYLGFSVCRLTKIGKDHGKVIVALSNLKIKTYVIISFVISAGLAVCKPLVNQIIATDDIFSESGVFPQPIFEFGPDWIENKKYVAMFIVNFVSNLINYFLFVFVHLFVDVVLINKLVAVFREREDKMREMKKSEREMEEASKQNEESKRRAVYMVVLNSTLNFLTRSPLMITFLSDLRYLIQNKYEQVQVFQLINVMDEFDPSFSFKFFCSSQKACIVFQSFGNCLFLLSLSTILFFLKRFDKNFKTAYQEFLSSNKNDKNKKK